jgi:Fur family transcriptional regulator, peroxide stress response regulator
MADNYHTRLNAVGIRPSVQRVAVYAYLCEHPVHPTVETVYSALSSDYPTLSKTTIYNTLRLFEEKKIVQTIKIEDDKLRYDADTTPHLHFKCAKCGRVFDIFDDHGLPEYIAECGRLLPEGFSIEKMQTNIWGICADCAASEKKA